MIDVDGVSLSFGDTTVLSAVDLDVRAGEFVGLVGPNGAGKTTLLRTVNGLLAPDAGEVRVDGESVAALDAKAVGRRVATVPQDTHLDFAFTVEQVVEMGRTPHRSRLDWTDDTEAVERGLARTETAHLADRSVDEVSGGERQRVLIARALAQETPVLVLDEPTASLDVNHQVRVLELVRKLVDDGRTAIAAIHDLDLAARYCDRLALLSEGEIVAVGRPETVLSSASVERAFDTAAVVGEAELTGSPRVTALGSRPDRGISVHVVGGGRPGARALGACWRAGFDVSVGVVPDGDVAGTLADDLGQPAVTATPFESPDADVRAAIETCLREADVVVQATPAPDRVTEGLLPEAGPVVAWADVVDDPGALADPPYASGAPDGDEPTPSVPGSRVVGAVRDAVAGSVAGDD